MKLMNVTLTLALLMSSQPAKASDEIIVVANLAEPAGTMQKHEVRNLFMGGASSRLEPVTLVPGAQTRLIFNARIVGLTESRIQSYWAQMRFSGRNKAPVQVQSVDAMMEYLLENQGSVGYLPADVTLPETLTVLYTSG